MNSKTDDLDPSKDLSLVVTPGDEFEECLEFSWELEDKTGGKPARSGQPKPRNSAVELVLNLKRDTDAREPPKDATVKRVDCGPDMSASLQNMPEGRRFFLAVIGTMPNGSLIRSEWVHVQTLHPSTRDKHLGNIDPMDKPRLNCKTCVCSGYVASKWTQFSAVRCRRCGCKYDSHVAVDVAEILHKREEKARETYKIAKVKPLPNEAVRWDDRECSLWFLSDGQVHPRLLVGEGRAEPTENNKIELGGPYGLSGKKGRVSIVTPTTESRHQFHENLWRCFQAQEWPDKELVVVETFSEKSSTFFQQLAPREERLIYVRFKVPADRDWSIGLKRNIGAHLASGAYIANFDDDDIYGPTYLSTMVGQLEMRKAQAITLSSWYIYDTKSRLWSYCDTIAWGLAQGKDERDQDVKNWAYGYGFSYVNRRRASLDSPYDDRNMGEDYAFIAKLQQRKTEKCVQLFQDDFGICVHVQHGGNTSNTFPIRDVERYEVAQLEVAEMAKIIDSRLTSNIFRPNKQHSVLAFTPYGNITVKCTAGISVAKFLELLQEQTAGRPCSNFKMHVVPPPGHALKEERESIAAKVLGVERLMEHLASTKPDFNAESAAVERKKLMLERVKSAMRSEDRIPLLITTVWVVLPQDGEAERQSSKALQLDDGLQKEEVGKLTIVDASVQALNTKTISKILSFQVMLAVGATVQDFRDVVGQDLPRTARLAAAGDLNMERALKDSDCAPRKIVVSDFKGKRSFYVTFTPAQCSKNLSMLKAYFSRPEGQAQIAQTESESGGNESTFRINLSHLLIQDAYPAIFRHYGAEVDGMSSIKALMDGMHCVGEHVHLLEQQLEVEALMRSRLSAQHVVGMLQRKHEELKLPAYECPPKILKWLAGGPVVTQCDL